MTIRTRRRVRHCIAVPIAVIGLAPLHVAWAQSAPRESSTRNDPTGAHAHYEQGRALYLQGRFLDAAREFRAAYEATLEPAFLYNTAMALYDGGDLAAAGDAFRAYLREQPNTPNRAVIEQRVATIDRRMHESASPVVTVAQSTAAPATASSVRSPLAWVGLAFGAAGLVTAGVGVGLYLRVDAQYQRCLPNLCDPSDQPRTLDAASVGMIWGGAALTIVGTAMFLFVPRVRVGTTASAIGIDPRGGASLTIHF